MYIKLFILYYYRNKNVLKDKLNVYIVKWMWLRVSWMIIKNIVELELRIVCCVDSL